MAIRVITLWSSGLYKTELIRKKGPWKAFEDVEFATLDWVGWFNNRRLLEPIGHVPLQGKVNFGMRQETQALPVPPLSALTTCQYDVVHNVQHGPGPLPSPPSPPGPVRRCAQVRAHPDLLLATRHRARSGS